MCHQLLQGTSVLLTCLMLLVSPANAGAQPGVRIKDDVLVTPRGPKVLSDGLARSVEEIERLMQERGKWTTLGRNSH